MEASIAGLEAIGYRFVAEEMTAREVLLETAKAGINQLCQWSSP